MQLEIENLNILLKDHQLCTFKFMFGACVEYFSDLSELWLSLVNFIMETCEQGIKGTDHLNLDRYEEGGKLLFKGECSSVLENSEEKTQAVLCYLLPNVSMRLVIEPICKVDTDIEEDILR